MKTINYKDYDINSGLLIDVEEDIVFKKDHLYGAVNIPFEKLLGNYKRVLDKNKNYYIYCRFGKKSKKVCSILEYYGYNVTQVRKE